MHSFSFGIGMLYLKFVYIFYEDADLAVQLVYNVAGIFHNLRQFHGHGGGFFCNCRIVLGKAV